ncbi:MAG: hypothetical protein ABIJ34_07650 [archaeon]
MQSKILFLGTAGDSFTAGKQMRASGGIIFSYEDSQFHIEPGPGSLVMAKMTSINLRETSTLIVTGNDLIKANDLNMCISAMTHEGLDKRGVLICPSDVAAMSAGNIPILNPKYQEFLEKTIVVDNTRKIGINNIDFEIIELKEPISKNYAFKIITPKFNLSYVPNTAYSAELGENLRDTDILILNVPEPRGSDRRDSLNSEDAEKIIKKADPQLVLITGFGIKMLQADPLYEIREIQKNSGVQAIAAKDGMTINPMSFASTVRQKSLRHF